MTEPSGTSLDGLYATLREHGRRLDGLDEDNRELRRWREKITTDLAEVIPLIKSIDQQLKDERQRRDDLATKQEEQQAKDKDSARVEHYTNERWRITTILWAILAAFVVIGTSSALVTFLLNALTRGHP